MEIDVITRKRLLQPWKSIDGVSSSKRQRGRKVGVNEEKEREKKGEMEIGNAHNSSLEGTTTIDQKAKRVNKAGGSVQVGFGRKCLCVPLCPSHCAHSHKAAQPGRDVRKCPLQVARQQFYELTFFKLN